VLVGKFSANSFGETLAMVAAGMSQTGQEICDEILFSLI
jgi:hypothetical protein